MSEDQAQPTLSSIPATQPAPASNPLAAEIADALGQIGQMVLLFAAGDEIGAGKLAVELGIALLPADILRAHLTAKGVQLANEAADAFEKAKFGG